jgi:hypothetical protein
MALKLLKINVALEIKGDPNDLEDLKHRVSEYLQIVIENDELEFELVDEDQEDAEDE